jgi:DnaJ-class molecular chaperone
MSDADDRKQSVAGGSRNASGTSRDGAEGKRTTAEESHEPRVCMPCHGTGQVISNLGGLTSKVTCPWCRGGGERLTGVDAQEWQQEQAASKRH